jgi:hypothetical protein
LRIFGGWERDMGWLRRRRRGLRAWQGRVRETRLVPIPDGDTVLAPGQARWADLLATRELPLVSSAPLLTVGQEHRSAGGGNAAVV